jgi:dTDP-4-dehydrorhamnose 3,5-epimerase-like enzyme
MKSKHDDPKLAISWPVADPVLSPKDQSNMSWADFVALLSRSA